jgi:hypothetical protein
MARRPAFDEVAAARGFRAGGATSNGEGEAALDRVEVGTLGKA